MATCGMKLAAWKTARSIGLGLILASVPPAALAAPADGGTAGAAQEHEQGNGEASDAEESHEHHANVLSLFLGHTSERVDGSEETEQGFYRIVGELRLVAGPGVEFRDAHSEEPEHHDGLTADPGFPTREHDTTVFLIRVGAVYEFEFGRWIVAPTVAIDFIGRDEAFVLGATIGYAF